MSKSNKSKSNPQKTLVTFLLDRTGSMEHIKQDTIGAFNAYLDGLGADDLILFSLVTFDSVSLDKVCVDVLPKEAPRLNDGNYLPRAWTPLIDASYKTIKAIEAKLKGFDQKPKVVVCIQTDGEENSSTEHSWSDLNALIREKTAEGWQFNFMGASLDAYVHAQKMGIAAGATLSYDSSQAGTTTGAFAAAAQNTQRFSAGQAADTRYTMSQRSASGDVFAANYLDAQGNPLNVTSVPQPLVKPQKRPQIVADFSLDK